MPSQQTYTHIAHADGSYEQSSKLTTIHRVKSVPLSRSNISYYIVAIYIYIYTYRGLSKPLRILTACTSADTNTDSYYCVFRFFVQLHCSGIIYLYGKHFSLFNCKLVIPNDNGTIAPIFCLWLTGS